MYLCTFVPNFGYIPIRQIPLYLQNPRRKCPNGQIPSQVRQKCGFLPGFTSFLGTFLVGLFVIRNAQDGAWGNV